MTLRIEKSESKGQVVFALSGRIDKEHVEELQELFKVENGRRPMVLDLKEVTLVNREAVAFLALCKTKGIGLKDCPGYIREWIEGERV